MPIGRAAPCHWGWQYFVELLPRLLPHDHGIGTSVALPGLIVFRMGLGLMMPVTFNSGTRGVDAKRTGLASAILSAAQRSLAPSEWHS